MTPADSAASGPDSVEGVLEICKGLETDRAIREEWCNGCHQPRKRWGPICPGMQVGDFTHYHSPEFWLYRQVRP